MGLLFQFPIDEEDYDFFKTKEINGHTWRIAASYGLPPIFWLYLVAIITIVSALLLGSWTPLMKLLSYPGVENKLIVYGLLGTVFLSVIILCLFYFYQKVIKTNGDELVIIHKVFGLPLRSQRHHIKRLGHTFIRHYMDSPNIAKKKNLPQSRGFQNKGYFQLYFLTDHEREIFLDRSSRKQDLIKLAALLFNTYEIRHVS